MTDTVREAARMFEAAGVARTERSMVNWCQQNIYIERLQSDQTGLINQLVESSHKVGELETKLLQWEGPKGENVK